MIIRIVGIVLILTGTTYAGFFARYRMQMRIRCLQAFDMSFVLMQQELVFAQVRMAQICEHIVGAVQNECVCEFYNNLIIQLQNKEKQVFATLWKQEIYKSMKSAYLQPADVTILTSAGCIPFCLDGKAQANMIGKVEQRLNQQIIQLQTQYEQKRKLYQYGGISAGIFVVILLL